MSEPKPAKKQPSQRKYKGTRVTSVLNKPLYSKVALLAELEGISVSKMVEKLCELGITTYKKNNEK